MRHAGSRVGPCRSLRPVSAVKDPPKIISVTSFANAGALVFAASLVLSIGGFAFHAIASRKLGVEDYGSLYSLIALYGLAGFPVAIFTSVITKYAAEFSALHDDAHVRGLIDLIVKTFAVCGFAYVFAAIVFERPLGNFLHVPVWEIPTVGVMVAVGILSGTLRAIGQGVHDYLGFAWSTSLEGILKVTALALFILAGLSVSLGITAFLIGIIGGAVIIAYSLAKRYLRVASAPIVLDWKRILATIGGSASLSLMMTFIGMADVLIVKHFFSATDAGLYSSASLCGKILLYFVGFVPVVLIPQATYRHARGERTRRTLWSAVLFVAVVSVCGVFAYGVLGFFVLHALVGHSFDAAIPLLQPYATAMACLALTNTLGAYGIATHRLAFVIPLVAATCGTLTAIYFVHPSLATVVNELVVGNIAMLLSISVPLAIQGLREKRL